MVGNVKKRARECKGGKTDTGKRKSYTEQIPQGHRNPKKSGKIN